MELTKETYDPAIHGHPVRGRNKLSEEMIRLGEWLEVGEPFVLPPTFANATTRVNVHRAAKRLGVKASVRKTTTGAFLVTVE